MLDHLGSGRRDETLLDEIDAILWRRYVHSFVDLIYYSDMLQLLAYSEDVNLF